ncbi:hypothetical protein LQ953_02975 [Sphingomonas sp. IC-56]|uniref:hypothetical protein n=1 Tax=Sphingomonas sp. IC-56 TaxID=2898529 RepID=UPI001E2A70C8|nr:hypothetical protein [Sphingomonas sp. IC-56]MCD2322977.1 hypothetical protein [Sphingomonas sp. IC-56]
MTSTPNQPNSIDNAMDKMSVAPGPESDGSAKAPVGSADAGTDKSISERLARNPDNKDARLDCALDESMDASDPPSTTQPGRGDDLPESSGFDPKAEKKLAGGDQGGVIDKIKSAIGLG